jgi:hypothetical protein
VLPTAVPPTAVPTTAPTAVPTPEIYDAPGALELPLPLTLDAATGDVIDTETFGVAGAIGQRILYHSTSAQGDDVAVSGFVVYPEGDAPEGGWPLIARHSDRPDHDAE